MFRRTIRRIVRAQSGGLRYARPLTRFIPFAVVCLIASVACASSMRPTPASAPAVSGAQFVAVEDGRFTLDGQPHPFAGVNFWQAMNLGAEGNRAQLLAELDRLQALGVSNVRVMAASEGPNGEPQRLSPALMTAPGEYDPAVLDGLDFLLAELGRREMRAVLVLNNFWQWSGGMAQYVAWAEGSAIPYPGDWERFQAYAARFYACADCQRWYRQHIETLLQRTNPYTGLPYRDDPTIFAWELANEPLRYPQRWVDDTAAFIQALDPNHLVTTGTSLPMAAPSQPARAAPMAASSSLPGSTVIAVSPVKVNAAPVSSMETGRGMIGFMGGAFMASGVDGAGAGAASAAACAARIARVEASPS
jgi:endo-1,4-beta-mannosidase